MLKEAVETCRFEDCNLCSSVVKLSKLHLGFNSIAPSGWSLFYRSLLEVHVFMNPVYQYRHRYTIAARSWWHLLAEMVTNRRLLCFCKTVSYSS